MPIKSANKYLYPILSCVIFSFGYLMSKITNLPFFSIQKEINPLHLLSILTTILVAVLISIIFDQHKEKNKIGKSLFFKRINDIDFMLDKLHETLESSSIDLIHAISVNKRLRSAMTFVFIALKKNKIIVDTQKAQIDKYLKELNVSMTSTPVSSAETNSSPTIEIRAGLITYSDQRASQIGSQIEVLRNELFKLQMLINDH